MATIDGPPMVVDTASLKETIVGTNAGFTVAH